MKINNILQRSVIAAAALIITNTVVANAEQELITVLNPVVESKLAERLPLTKRLDTLDGKTLYLVDINWGGPDAAYGVFQQMEAWLAQKMPTVKVEIRRLRGSYMMDDPALYKEIADNGDAALIGISG